MSALLPSPNGAAIREVVQAFRPARARTADLRVCTTTVPEWCGHPQSSAGLQACPCRNGRPEGLHYYPALLGEQRADVDERVEIAQRGQQARCHRLGHRRLRAGEELSREFVVARGM